MPTPVTTAPAFIDGDFSTPVKISQTAYEYPFAYLGDLTTKTYWREYVVDVLKFTPTARGTVDPDLAGHYLFEETPLQINQGRLATFRRRYGSIPAQQIKRSSIDLSRPALSGSFPQVYGAYRLIQPDTSLLRYDAYYAQTVTADSGAPTFSPTAGTYKLTVAGEETSALAYDATAGTVQTALNNLTQVANRGNVVVSGAYNTAGGIVVTFNDYAQITIDPSSLTGGTIAKRELKVNGGYNQTVGANIGVTVSDPSANTTGLITRLGTGTTTGHAINTAYSGYTYIDGGVITNSFLPGGADRRAYKIRSVYGAIVGGTYTLTIGAYTTGAIAFDADQAAIQAALDAVAPGAFQVQAWPSPYTDPAGLNAGTTPSYAPSEITFSIVFLSGAPTGGTFTLTVGANTTTALAYNASAATVQTALNLLTSVTNRGGCTVSGTLSTGYVIAFTNAVISANSSSLTPTGSQAVPAITDGIGKAQKITFTSPSATRDIYIANHGIASGGALYLKSGSTYYSPVTNYTVVDANTIRLGIFASDAWASIGTITEAGARTKSSYTAGAITVAAQIITDFYLPGVTSGITTADDIVIPYAQSDGVDLLLAIFSNSSAVNYRVGQLTNWLDGPIFALSRTVVDASKF